MEITYTVIVMIVTGILGAVNKAVFTSFPNKFIPLQNVVIGIISGLICYYGGFEPNLMQSLVLCLTASMGAGGVADITLK